MPVRRMTLKDLDHVLGWAGKEGWNPGLEDAAAFYAADPEGFFVNEVDGEIAAAISVVNHSDAAAFLGLYICEPKFRGRGLGMEVWGAALEHAGDRTIGLDGVPDQQENYRKSGFVSAGKTTRYQGVMPECTGNGASKFDLSDVMRRDAIVCGFQRPLFARAWFADSATRKTVALPSKGGSQNFLTIRECQSGLKIGPLVADSAQEIDALFSACPVAYSSKSVMIDVPDSSPDLAVHLTNVGFEPIFETARMYKGRPPSADPPKFYATATLELG